MSKEELLAKCIDEIDSGKCTIAECLAKHPDLSDELRPLLEIAQCLQSENAAPSPEFKARARSRLLQEMRTPVSAVKRKSGWALAWSRLLAPVSKPVVAASLVVIGLSAAGGATVALAQGSLPQDSLYPVKRSVENLQLALTTSPTAKARFNATLAQRRIDEVLDEARLGRGIEAPVLADAASDMDAAVRELGAAKAEDVKALLGSLSWSSLKQQMELNQALSAAPAASQPAIRHAIDTARRAGLIAQIAYNNPSFLSTSPSVEDAALEGDYFKVDGVFLGVENGSWNVGGVLIQNVSSTAVTPATNESIRVEGVVRNDQAFISEVRQHDAPADTVTVQGSFQGASADGTQWRVGGLPVTMSQDKSPVPQTGSQVQVLGTVRDGGFVGATAENENTQTGVEVAGTLVGANTDQKTVALSVSGSNVVINLGQASIQDIGGKPLQLTDLTSLSGVDVKVSGLRQEDGVLSARQVQVDATQNTSQDSLPPQGGDVGVLPGQNDNHQNDNHGTATPTQQAQGDTRQPGQTYNDNGSDSHPTATPTKPAPEVTPMPKATSMPTSERQWATVTPTPRPTGTTRSYSGYQTPQAPDETDHDGQTYGH